MNIIRKARGTEIPKQAQRIFLCYNEHDSTGRDSIISDLLSIDAGMNCVVSYLEKPNAAIDDDLLRNELFGTHLLVIWITFEMLKSITYHKLSVEYRIAKELNIPILPILDGDGLFQLYNEKFGFMYCISKYDHEYRTNLKNQIEKSLISDDTVERIKEKAFTSTIFVSYRKHERSEALRFMKIFHDLEGFESISIWYDNFLIAGSDVSKDIEKAISDSNALVLIVTPDLATEHNYPRRIEYPFAQWIGRPVVSVEVISTSHTKFEKFFPGTDRPISIENTSAIQTAFRDKLGESAFVKSLDSERAYLLGMAYLNGIGVERDFDRAIRLLSFATEGSTTDSFIAANQLANIYENGKWINICFDKALQWYKKSLTIQEKIIGTKHPDIAITYNSIALVYNNLGIYLKALEWHEKALVILEKILGKEHPDTATTYNNIALVYNNQGNYSKALEFYEKALVIREKILGEKHLDTATTYNNIALVYNNLGDYQNALEWYKKALDIREQIIGKEHPDTATTYNNIALVYNNLGDYQNALKWYKKALDIQEKVLGKKHPHTATTYNNIAISYYYQRNLTKAQKWLEKALSVYEKVLGKEHPDTATTYNNIALVYNNQGNYSKALEWYMKALGIREQMLGKEHPDTATTYNNIALVYNNLGDYQNALEWNLKALAIQEKVLGKKHPHTATTYNNIAKFYYYQGEFTIAKKLFKKALGIREQMLGKEHPDTATTYNNIALVYNNLGDYQNALEWNLKALAIQESVLGKEHPDTATTYNNIALVYNNLGEYSKALEWNLKVLVIQEKTLGDGHPNTVATYNNIANAYYKQGDDSKALIFFEKSKKDILELFVNMHRNKMGEFKKRKIFHKLLDKDKHYGDFFKETIGNYVNKGKINDFKDIYLASLYIVSQLYIDNNLDENLIAYYTEKKTSQALLFNNSEFRLNAINYSNDPTEGKTLLDYLFGKNNYPQHEIVNTDYGAFAACFTFNYDSLNQFRLYGKDKEDRKEGTGLSIIFKPSFFSKGEKIPKLLELKNKILIEDNILGKNDSLKGDKSALFRCIYIDPETERVETVGQKDAYLFFRDENNVKVNKIIEDKIHCYQKIIIALIKSVRIEMEKLKENIRKLKLTADEKIIVGQLLLNLRYLSKHIAFKEEQECRILKICPLDEDMIKTTDDFKQMYVDYYKIQKYVKRICFGPKATEIELFQDVIKNKKLGIPCEKSTNPLA